MVQTALNFFPSLRCALLLLLFPVASGVAQIGLPSDMNITGAASYVYVGNEIKPVALIRVDHIFNDFQRKGFFRIGVLPMLVLDGLNLELCDTARLSTVLTNVSASFIIKNGATRLVEGRNFLLSFSMQKNVDVRARVIRLQSSTEWRLQDGMIRRFDAPPIRFRHATLKVSGPNSGELTCDTAGGTIHIRLLSLVTSKDHQPLHQ